MQITDTFDTKCQHINITITSKQHDCTNARKCSSKVQPQEFVKKKSQIKTCTLIHNVFNATLLE